MSNTNHNLLFKAIILALCVISFVHVFLFPLYGINIEGTTARTFHDFEQSLCTNNIKHRKLLKRGKCPQYGIVTIMQGGRLGNQMWEYASVWALSRRTGLEPYIPRCLRIKLEQIFRALTVPTFEEITHCRVELTRFVKSLDEWNYTNQSILLPRYSLQLELVLIWVQDVIQEFSIKKFFLDKSQKILRSVAKNSSKYTFVGVHVRRTDYLDYVVRKYSVKPADFSFYNSAMTYFENKFRAVFFIIVSDDPLWCAKKFTGKSNTYITSRNHRNSPGLDLALLKSCNHSIFDYGTFGEWGAILAGGETIYYNLSQHSSSKLGQLLPNWHTL